MDLNIQELKADFMLDSLLRGETDAGIAISDNIRYGILEIPLYTEKFLDTQNIENQRNKIR